MKVSSIGRKDMIMPLAIWVNGIVKLELID
jgi:hypothetical protein